MIKKFNHEMDLINKNKVLAMQQEEKLKQKQEFIEAQRRQKA